MEDRIKDKSLATNERLAAFISQICPNMKIAHPGNVVSEQICLVPLRLYLFFQPTSWAGRIKKSLATTYSPTQRQYHRR